MSKRRRYNDKFRASALIMLEAQGYPNKKGALAEVSKHLAVPMSTLHDWYKKDKNPPPSELRTEKKGDLAALLRQEAEAILGAMPDAREEATFREMSVALGIVIDKLQLLGGQPTERHEIVSPRNEILSRFHSIATREQTASDPEQLQ